MTRTTAAPLVLVPPTRGGPRATPLYLVPPADYRFDWELRGRCGSWRAELFDGDVLIDDVESRFLLVLALRMIRSLRRARG